MSSPLRVLAFWAASDFEQFFRPAFLDRPEYAVEVISGDRSSARSEHAVDWSGVRKLRRRLLAGDFDLVLSGNIWNTPWPRHKSFWTALSVASRYWTTRRRMLDTYWAAWLMGSPELRHIPFAAVDVRDSVFVLPGDWPLLQSATLYFKRELFFWPSKSLGPLRVYEGEKAVDAQAHKLRPLSYGVRPSHLHRPNRPVKDRDIDLFVSGSNNPIREQLKERARRLQGKYKVEVCDGFLAEDLYDEMLQRAKLVICTESFGCETWRQYEVAAAGAVPLLNWTYAQNNAPFEPDRQAVYFSLIGDDFERQIERVLGQPELLQQISTATQAHVLAHKDRRAIGDYVIRTTLDYAQNRHA